jgi:hypothetical protein
MTPHGQRSYRNQLRRVVDMVHGSPTVSLNRAELGEMRAARRYTVEEEHAFRVMVSNQRTEHRRLNGEVLLALGFGAGLNSAEICRVHGHDIHKTDDGVEVHVSGECARVVPLFSEWESVLLAAAERTGARRVFMPDSKAVGRWACAAFVKRLEGKSTDLQVQRMRATWIVRLLDGGIRVNVLLDVAGNIDTCWISRYVTQMAPVPSAEAYLSVRALSRPGAEVPA